MRSKPVGSDCGMQLVWILDLVTSDCLGTKLLNFQSRDSDLGEMNQTE